MALHEPGTQMDVDPVCGMTIDAAKARHKEHAGRTWHFCSAKCEARFRSDPDKYPSKLEEPATEAHDPATAPVPSAAPAAATRAVAAVGTSKWIVHEALGSAPIKSGETAP